jgi:hypothetical protein
MIDQSGEAQVPNYPLLCHNNIMKTQRATDVLSVHRLTLSLLQLLYATT